MQIIQLLVWALVLTSNLMLSAVTFYFSFSVTFDNMKRLGFRAAFLSTDKNAGARTKPPQTTEPQLFYIVCWA